MERDDALLEAKLQAALKEVFGKDATFRANQLVRLDTGRCRTPRPPFLVSFLLTLRTPNTHPTPTQQETMMSLARGFDTLTCLPTGTGKTLPFALPPLALGGCFSLVITPLIALGTNQVKNLVDEMGVDARVWTNSESSKEAQEKMAADLQDEDGSIGVLITTPETIGRNNLLRSSLSIAGDKGRIFCVAVDEAHVAYPWGSEFRPSYRNLPAALQIIDRSRVPMYACTASANREARDQICEILGMALNANQFVASADRPEIQMSVVFKELLDQNERDPVVQDMIRYVRVGGSGIIYCREKNTVDRVCSMLRCTAGLEDLVAPYHAGLDRRTRERHQEAWEEGDVPVLIATVAFSMGINKPDVRFVLQYDPPNTLADLLQQAGRAGRDGKRAVTVLYASHEEVQAAIRFSKGDSSIMEYCYSGSCRRHVLTSYFGTSSRSCASLGAEFKCDVCLKSAMSVTAALERAERLAAERTAGRLGDVDTDESPIKRTRTPETSPIRPSVLQRLNGGSTARIATSGSLGKKQMAGGPSGSLHAPFKPAFRGEN